MAEHDDGVVDELGKEEAGPTTTWTAEEEKSALRHLDWSLIPLVAAMNLCSFLDRGNIGNAYAAGMGEEWGITSADYSWAITVLYIAYISFQWFTIIWTFIPPHIWTAIMLFGWGSASILQSVANNQATLLALRFLIGFFEAGFIPPVALYLSFFYHRNEMGLRYGLFISAAPLASTFASALAYGIVHAETSIANWKLLFIIEGIPTIIVASVAFFYLPASPSKCRFLTPRENEIISQRAIKGRGEKPQTGVNFQQVLAAFMDPTNYLQAAIIFSINTAYGSFPAYLPTILSEIGFSTLNSQGLSAAPYLIAFFLCVGASFLSDRMKSRGVFVIVCCIVGSIGYVLLATVHTTAVRYFACFVVAGGLFPAVAVTFAWVTDNQGSASKRGAGLTIFGSLGQTGPILGARLFPKSEAPYYTRGMAVCAGILFGAALVAVVLTVTYRVKNKRRDEKYGKSDLDFVPPDVADLGDAHPMYRYVV
ncbi:major facilitator superfamily domain-containing protein [Xylariaceae sp. FL1019]|nr:major facilitator superfamily domain-containing protein [Xylariaceae sp. FL1019]